VSLIYPTAYYYSLFANQNEELIDIVRALVDGVSKGRGGISNNQIHINNIVKMREKKFILADWGCATFRESFTIQGRAFNKDLPALCRDGE
jgi:hypothetical protein